MGLFCNRPLLAALVLLLVFVALILAILIALILAVLIFVLVPVFVFVPVLVLVAILVLIPVLVLILSHGFSIFGFEIDRYVEKAVPGAKGGLPGSAVGRVRDFM